MTFARFLRTFSLKPADLSVLKTAMKNVTFPDMDALKRAIQANLSSVDSYNSIIKTLDDVATKGDDFAIKLGDEIDAPILIPTNDGIVDANAIVRSADFADKIPLVKSKNGAFVITRNPTDGSTVGVSGKNLNPFKGYNKNTFYALSKPDADVVARRLSDWLNDPSNFKKTRADLEKELTTGAFGGIKVKHVVIAVATAAGVIYVALTIAEMIEWAKKKAYNGKIMKVSPGGTTGASVVELDAKMDFTLDEDDTLKFTILEPGRKYEIENNQCLSSKQYGDSFYEKSSDTSVKLSTECSALATDSQSCPGADCGSMSIDPGSFMNVFAESAEELGKGAGGLFGGLFGGLLKGLFGGLLSGGIFTSLLSVLSVFFIIFVIILKK